MIDITHLFWIFVPFYILLLVIGFYCILVTYNLIRVIIGIEILIKAVTLLIISAGYLSGQMALAQGIVITLIVIEVVIITVAMGIILGFQKEYDSINVNVTKELKG